MKHRKYQFVLLFLSILLSWHESFVIAQESTITLKSCQETAISNYPASKDKELLKQVSLLKIRNLETNYLPQVTLNGQATYQSDAIQLNTPIMKINQPKDQYKGSVDINQLIFDGGTNRYMKELESTSSEADLQQVEVDLFKVREQVNNVFFLLISLQENEKLLKANLSIISEREKVVVSSVKQGVLTSSDLDVLQAEKLNTEQQLSDISINRKSSLTILTILTNKIVTDSSFFELPKIELNVSDANIRPEYKLFDLQAKRFDDNRSLTGSMLMPKIYAFGEGGYGRPGLNMLSDKFSSFYIIGATLKWNLFDWNKNHRDKEVLDFQKQMVGTRRETFDKNLNVDLQNKMSSIQKLQEAIKRDVEILVLRHRITQTSSSRLDNGVITSTDYLTDFNAETVAKINAQTHIIQLEQAKTAYLLAKGQY